MIQIYLMDIRQLLEKDIFEQAYEEMLPKRKKAIDSFRQKEDRLRSLAAGILRRQGLLELGIREEEEVFLCNAHGKEYLQGKAEVQFNLSHAGNYAVAAFGKKELGIDMEQKDRGNLRAAARFFTKKEQEYLQEISEEKRKREETVRLWTRKESFVKAIGAGLFFGIQNVETSDGKQPEILAKGSFPTYFFHEYEFPGYWITVCAQEAETEKKMRWVEIDGKKFHSS